VQMTLAQFQRTGEKPKKKTRQNHLKITSDDTWPG